MARAEGRPPRLPEGSLPCSPAPRVDRWPRDIRLPGAFAPDGRSLVYISDETGWGHLYRRDLESGTVSQLTDGEFEHGAPAWGQGMRTFTFTQSGRIVSVRQRAGFHELIAVSPDGQVTSLADREAGYSAYLKPLRAPRTTKRRARGRQRAEATPGWSSSTSPSRRPAARSAAGATLRPSPGAPLRPEPVSWTSFDGEQAHASTIPPASEQFEGAGAPPLIVLVHGGPTSQVNAGWAPNAQFFATRGYAVLLPNYRGSTGYGREYMLKLRESWGIYDVQDAKFGAEALAQRGLADPSRLVIMGGSAGGFTVLQSLVEIPGFYKAAICMFGVANQFTLAADTHKFEARYLDSMLGPLPEAAAVYRERSPIFHADRITDPIAVFQGDIDRVVPREQSDSIVASLRARGVPHEYHVYEGEGHGWRKSETIDQFYKSVEAFLRTHVLFA